MVLVMKKPGSPLADVDIVPVSYGLPFSPIDPQQELRPGVSVYKFNLTKTLSGLPGQRGKKAYIYGLDGTTSSTTEREYFTGYYATEPSDPGYRQISIHIPGFLRVSGGTPRGPRYYFVKSIPGNVGIGLYEYKGETYTSVAYKYKYVYYDTQTEKEIEKEMLEASISQFPLTEEEIYWLLNNTFRRETPEEDKIKRLDGSTESEKIGLPILPPIGGSELINMYSPTPVNLVAFNSYLWTDNLFDNFSKLYSNPHEAIIGLQILPFEVKTSGESNIKLGKLDSKITVPTINARFQEFNFGKLQIGFFYGNYLDYGDNTKISIYLPFIGTKELKTNDVMGNEIEVVYRVDVLTGIFTACILINGSCLYQYNGNASINVPLSGSDLSNIIRNSLSTLGTAVVSGLSGNPLPMVMGGINMLSNSTTHVQHSGNLSGNSGYLGVTYPYIYMETPIYKELKPINGNLTLKNSNIGAYSGFTKVENPQLNISNATESEINEIKNLLKNGVIL